MNDDLGPYAARHQRCQQGERCNGPGCRVYTGKTARKQNHLRPKRNKHEATRISAVKEARR